MLDQTSFYSKYDYAHSTPVMQQYLEKKYLNQDCLLLFRMGDFYELFYQDALLASDLLNIVLTKRGKSNSKDIEMCGIPHHALDVYLVKLIDAGYKVAICEQLESPEEAKKRGYKAIVKRDVVRVLTPGTLVDSQHVNVAIPNYLLSIVKFKDKFYICYCDFGACEVYITDTYNPMQEIARIEPKEIIISAKLQEQLEELKSFKNLVIQVESHFATRKCENIILDFYSIRDINSIGNLQDGHISALGAVLEYINLTQKSLNQFLKLPIILNPQGLMLIDPATIKNLDIFYNSEGKKDNTLFSVINNTITSSGSRLLYQYLLSPLSDIVAINQRLETVQFLYNNYDLYISIRDLLKYCGDGIRSLAKIINKKAIPRDLIVLRDIFRIGFSIKEYLLENCNNNIPSLLCDIIRALPHDQSLYKRIYEVIVEDAPISVNEGNFIRKSYHYRLDELRELISNSHKHIDQLKTKYQNKTKVDNLKINHNNLLGFYVEVSSKQVHKIVDEIFIHKHTTTNAVRFITDELKDLENKILNSKVLAVNLEIEILNNLCAEISEHRDIIQGLCEALASLDVFSTFTYNARQNNYVKPNISEASVIDIENGRHPIVESNLLKSAQEFVSNSVSLGNNSMIWLITGPNMGGKSTFLRQNALLVILAQIGSFVPAKSATIGIVDKIFSRIGASDDIAHGRSTFMVEMTETAGILAQASKKSLVILDEIGRGTSTFDGISIAWSILEYMHNNIGARCIFATHYHELTKLEDSLNLLKNYTVEVIENKGEVVFTHRVISGIANKSYGIYVAQLAGLPFKVISLAKQILISLENKDGQKIENLKNNHIKENCSAIEESTEGRTYRDLEQYILNLDPDNISPKQALEFVYEIKSILLKYKV